MLDIMLRTKATGHCVESYFQQFGTKMKHGLTELTPPQFQQAVQGLNISWADDQTKIMSIFDILDKDKSTEERGTLGLDELAIAVIDTVKCSY